MNTTTTPAVLITGASQGIGKATAELFAAQGHPCILLARDEAALEALRGDLLQRFDVPVHFAAVDVRDSARCVATVRELASTHSPGVVVVNAGVGQYGPVNDSAWSDIENVLRTNIDGALATVHGVLPALLAQGRGSIVFISSVLGRRAIPYNAAYCASKFALQGYADALRLELRPQGVHVGVVYPARTDTAFFDRMTYSLPQRERRAVPTSPPSRVARAVYRCVIGQKRAVYATPEGWAFSFAGHHFPRLTDFVLSRMVPRPENE
jgi:short-subunit dehydrogenase